MDKKSCRSVNEVGGTMIELKDVRVENNRLVVTGALMGAWDTDMYMDVEDIKAAVGIVDLPAVLKYIMNDVLGVSVTKN